MRAVIFLIAGFLFLVSTAKAQPPEPIVPSGLEWQVRDYGFSPAVRAGDFIFVSGVVAGYPKDENGAPSAASEAAIEAGFERALDRLEEILAASGAGWSDVVEMTTYHIDLPTQGPVLVKAKARRMSAPYPAWTAIDVDRLWPDNGFCEIRLTGYKPLE